MQSTISITKRHLAAKASLLLALCTLSLLVFVASARADSSFCQSGPAAGQCENPQGVAVDNETGRLYVADRDNNRVVVFDANGTFVKAFGWGVADGTTNALQSCTATCFKGIAGAGAGQFDEPTQIAVDNDPASASHHDLYVGTDNFRVQKFSPEGAFLLSFGSQGSGDGQLSGRADPIAVGPAGVVYVGDGSRVEKFDTTGAFVGKVKVAVPVEAFSLAVDSGGDIYVFGGSGFEGGIRKYDPSGAFLYAKEDGMEVTALAVDAADNLFAAQREYRDKAIGSIRVLTEFDSAGNYLHRWGYGLIDFSGSTSGLAAYHSAGGEVFGSEADTIHYFAFPPAGPLVSPESLEATPIGNAKATLKAEINPEGKATSYRFDYVTQKGYEEQGGFSGAQTKSTPLSALGATDFTLHGISAVVGCPNPLTEAGESESKCLAPETAYRYRVEATNADGKGNSPIEGTFTTKPPLEIAATYSTEVGTDTANLGAQVNPLGLPSTGYFEYVDDATYQADVNASGEGHGFDHATQIPNVGGGEEPIDFGAGEANVNKGVSLYPLAPGTTYHYRLIATDPLVEPIAGPERTLTTFRPEAEESCPANAAFRSGPAALLPDCRAYEMVSPLDKNGGDILALENVGAHFNTGFNEAASSGAKLTYSSYKSFGDAESAPFNTQYVASRGAGEWRSHAISPPISSVILPGRAVDTEFRAFSADLCRSWLRTVTDPPLAEGGVEGFFNIYRRLDAECGGTEYEALTRIEPPNSLPEQYYELELQGLSADGDATIYAAPDSLPGTGAPAQVEPECVSKGASCKVGLYYQQGEAPPVYACILPGGAPVPPPCAAGDGLRADGTSRVVNVQNAISADGSRVFWTTIGDKLYARENPLGEGAECAEASSPCTLAVSKEAEALSKASGAKFQTAADDGSRVIFTTGGDLYEFDLEEEETHLIAREALGMLGASEDAARIYFASKEVLSGPNPQGQSPAAGKANLYLFQEGSFDFLATLAAADGVGGRIDPLSPIPLYHRARVSPDGLHAAFMSFAGPTGYDNTDAVSGKADMEVYLYDASANGGGGKLVCASCNPSGARPVGFDLGEKRFLVSAWAAAQIPQYENTLYGTRVLSGDGTRLYFNSTDALSPRDTNGRQDVYQWEQAGQGGCDANDATFSAASGGCVSLISSGQSKRDAEFLDADPSGHDVFFATLASLVSQDYGLIDIYDARVGGGLPSPPAFQAQCEGEACQSPAQPPNDATPASASFHGQGNPRAKKAKKKKHAAKKRHKSKRHGSRANAKRRAGR